MFNNYQFCLKSALHPLHDCSSGKSMKILPVFENFLLCGVWVYGRLLRLVSIVSNHTIRLHLPDIHSHHISPLYIPYIIDLVDGNKYEMDPAG